ncbi:MAG: hypothetical protein WC823_04230 [Parcubacteria group bacterium]|jgi:hypothetical protein
MSVKDQVMQKIKQEQIEMRPAYFFWLKKIGLQSLLAFFVVLGALILNIAFYFLKKINALDALSFGWVGMDKFLLALPYDYIFLFIITMLLANLIIHQFDLSYAISMNTRVAALLLLVMTLLLSAFFLTNGIEDMLKVWDKNKVLEERVSSRAHDQKQGSRGTDFQATEH